MSLEKYRTCTDTNSDGFSLAIASYLTSIDAQLYIPIFQNFNFGKYDLEELTNEDLVLMGINSQDIRQQIISDFHKDLTGLEKIPKFTQNDKINITQETKKQLEFIRISLVFCKSSIQKNSKIEDVLITPKLYATDIMLDVIGKIENHMLEMQDSLKLNSPKTSKSTHNKSTSTLMLITFSGAIISLLTVCLIKSIKV